MQTANGEKGGVDAVEPKIILGFSGGVDSSAAALLLRQEGWLPTGVFLDMGDESAREAALSGAEQIRLPLICADIRRELEQFVCEPFCAGYLAGKTPIPCILCNPAVKFRKLLEHADELGAQWIATGHYARVKDGALYTARSQNDQSYMLCGLTREQLRRCRFPLGDFSSKAEVRAFAAAHSIAAADRPDSQEICFIPDRDYRAWIERRGHAPTAGDLVLNGSRFGSHTGIFHYTVGQRLPGFYDGRKLYVSSIDAAHNVVELCYWDELFYKTVYAQPFNWLIDPPQTPIRASVRVRHTKWEQPPCSVYPEQDGQIRILCDWPVRAPAPGQSAVLYDGERVLGGGTIVRAEK